MNLELGPLVPSRDQERAIQRIVSETTKSALNASTMGSGKTLKAVEVAKRLGAQTVLLIAPLNTRLAWMITFQRQGIELPFKWINSTKEGKANLSDWGWQQPGVYFVGVEYFVRLAFDEKRKHSGVWEKNPDIAIFDEVHRSQNRKSQTSKALRRVSAGFKLAMSGTPTGNRFDGAWAVTKWLWPDLIPNSYYQWVEQWCATEYDRFAPSGRKVIGEKFPGAFFNALPCYVRIESELDVDIDIDQVYVELTPDQRKAYAELESRMVTWIKQRPVIVEVPIALRIRLRQATLGLFSVSDEEEIVFENDCKSSKIDAMFDVLENDFDGEPALILTDSKKFAEVLVYRLRNAGLEALPWHGDISGTRRQAAKEAFVSGSCQYLVAVISAIAEGVDGLQNATRNVLWMNRSDNRILNQQAEKRVHRQGQTRMVRSREMIAIDTYDQGVLSSQIQAALEMNKTLREDGS
jgi:superfamily II DNA or RNA helicase